MAFEHVPVLLAEVLEVLAVRPGGRWLDGTVGGGGHAEAILERSAPDGVLVGADRDPAALGAARARLARFGPRVHLLRARASELVEVALPWSPYDGMLLDLGASSPQLDDPARGFSFLRDGPVDMRMDPDQELHAAGLLDAMDEAELVRILRDYGDEPRARRIARAVLAGRPWRSTAALAACVASASGWHGGRTHPATRTFQALRIAVNDELGELHRAIDAAPRLVRQGGRIAVIAFHSLEDRIVKRRFRALAGRDAPKDAYGDPVVAPLARLIAPGGLAGRDLDPSNPRARSARLRAAEILGAEQS